MTLDAAGEALLDDARAVARRALKAADDEARARIAQAQAEADALLARARAQGEAEGRLEAGLEEARERTLARMEVLAARREAYEELRRRARAAALALRSEAGYDELLEQLAAAARRDLGEDAELEIDPPQDGGVRASADGRRVDYTLVALADRCVDDLGAGLKRLWA
jgi:flagellar biosynthesis/type III secretory pathway protein FliH